MEIKFTSKYRSITPFTWFNIPDFVVITGPNGTGKSQLLELIYNSVLNKPGIYERVQIIGKSFKPDEITYLKGEWKLLNTNHVNLSTIQNYLNQQFQQFQQLNFGYNSEEQIRLKFLHEKILKKTGKSISGNVTREEFIENFPEVFLHSENELSQKMSEVFYNYLLSKIELKAKGKTANQIEEELGEPPWIVLREIIKESKLPFEVNDPSSHGIRDSFQLQLTHTVLNETVNFNDLSSGEKVLMSLVFYLYNSQEKNIFPKLLLLDEPDAHLHPSMSQNFLNVIKNVLVDKFNVQVIITTHSPSTVMLAPEESIFEMSRVDPRIQRSTSKNHSVSLLTAGLVYVGEGTKYFLVEDDVDVKFYSYIFNQLTIDGYMDASIPFVFISASTKDKPGGKDVVQNWVKKLQDSGLIGIVQGLIDADSNNQLSDGIFKINRYSIENYLADPILLYAALIDKEKIPPIEGISLSVGEEYKLKSLPIEILQKLVDKMTSMVDAEVKNTFQDFNESTDNSKVEVIFVDGKKLLYPQWLIKRRGKTIINEVYNKTFTSNIVNFKTLFKAMRKLNMFPKELIEKFNEMKEYMG